jgi:hypothetical protein
MLLGGILLGGIGVVTLVATSRNAKEINRYNQEQWPKLQQAWERSLLCMRCGHQFEAKP